MIDLSGFDQGRVARLTGTAILLVIALGIASAILVSGDININLNVDASQIIDNMSAAGARLYGKAWITVGLGLVDLLIAGGLFLLLRDHGRLLALWSLVVALAGGVFVLQVGLENLKIAVLLNSEGMAAASPEALRALGVGFLTGDYAAFHLGLVVNTLAKAGFFVLFIRSRTIPPLISWWGLFASLFVATAIVGRDFIPALGHAAITTSFLVSNLVAHLALGIYLAVRGLRPGEL